MEQDQLKELFKSDSWQAYLEVVETEMVQLFMELFQLTPSDANSFVRFVELKAKIDQLRNVTYFYERQVVDDVAAVDASYYKRFKGLINKIFGGS